MLLNTDSIRLRAPEISDADVIYLWENSTEDWHSSYTIYAPLSITQIQDHIRNCNNDPFADRQLRLMLENKETGETIGTVELTNLNPLNGTATVGFYIAAEHRYKGIGSAMIRLIVEYCSDYLGLNSLVAYTAVGNCPARSILGKNNFKEVGRLQSWLRSLGGAREDMLIYQCLFVK